MMEIIMRWNNVQHDLRILRITLMIHFKINTIKSLNKQIYSHSQVTMIS